MTFVLIILYNKKSKLKFFLHRLEKKKVFLHDVEKLEPNLMFFVHPCKKKFVIYSNFDF